MRTRRALGVRVAGGGRRALGTRRGLEARCGLETRWGLDVRGGLDARCGLETRWGLGTRGGLVEARCGLVPRRRLCGRRERGTRGALGARCGLGGCTAFDARSVVGARGAFRTNRTFDDDGGRRSLGDHGRVRRRRCRLGATRGRTTFGRRGFGGRSRGLLRGGRLDRRRVGSLGLPRAWFAGTRRGRSPCRGRRPESCSRFPRPASWASGTPSVPR